MNSLDNLRSTLERHAEEVHDTEQYARPVAVRERIRVARRRRTTAAGVATALVLVGGVAAVAQLRTPDSIEPAGQVAGVDVPGDIDVLGFPYELDKTAPIREGQVVWVPDGDAYQAVTLAASGLGDGSATLYRDSEPVARVRGDQQLSVPVPLEDLAGALRVRLDGTPAGARAGVATYRATGDLADGVDDGTSVFRDTVAGDRLVTAAFADPGATSVTVHVRGALEAFQYATRCTADPADRKGLWLNVSVDDDGALQSSNQCADAGPDNTPQSGIDGRVVRRHTLTVYATRGRNGPRVAVSELGLGVYSAQPGVDVMGDSVSRQVEYAGRTWALDRIVTGRRTTVDTADGDALLGFSSRGHLVWTSWRGRLTRGESTAVSSPAHLSGGQSLGDVLLAGDRYDVRLHTQGADAEGAMLIYRPL